MTTGHHLFVSFSLWKKMYGISSMFFTMQTQMPPHPPNLENGFLFPVPWSSYLGRTAVLWSEEHGQVQTGVSVVSESEKQPRGNLRPHSMGRLSNLWMSHLNPNVPLNSLSTLNAAWHFGQLIKGYLHRPGNNHWKLDYPQCIQNLLPLNIAPALMSRKPANTGTVLFL